MRRYNVLSAPFTVFLWLCGSWTLTAPTSALASEPENPLPTSELQNGADEIQYPPGYIKEAPLPEGFPLPSELGQVIEKTYPACRTYSAKGKNAFMRCFAYLSKKQHEMTAPVIMDYLSKPDASEAQSADRDLMELSRMHFILENPSLDEPKHDGPVTVDDIPSMHVLSIALQGQMSATKLDEAERKLAAEIARRKVVVAAGPTRVLGYNSPMVPRGKAYWEVQVPIKERTDNIAR